MLVVVLAGGALLVSGGTSSDPRTPAGLPGLPPPFLGVAVVGDGGLTAAVDSYGVVVDLRPAPAGPALIDNPAERQAAGTVAPDTGIVPRLRLRDGRALPFWRADAVAQRYLPGTNVLETTARFGQVRARVIYAARGSLLACVTGVAPARSSFVSHSGTKDDRARLSGRDDPREHRRRGAAAPTVRLAGDSGSGAGPRCDDPRARGAIAEARRADRRWLRASTSPGSAAPAWAEALYRRSLLVLRALTDARTGAVSAGSRDGWAYVWPRDAATAALAFAVSGHPAEARRAAGFLDRLDLGAAARFHGDGSPVPGRDAQGDAAGGVDFATRASGAPAGSDREPGWRERPDYQEKAPGEFLGNAIAATASEDPARLSAVAIAARFAERGALTRTAVSPGSGIDSAAEHDSWVDSAAEPGPDIDAAAAWAVRPFALPRLYAPARKSLRHLLAAGGRFGIVPSADWPEVDRRGGRCRSARRRGGGGGGLWVPARRGAGRPRPH